jgi:hypothetical protein
MIWSNERFSNITTTTWSGCGKPFSEASVIWLGNSKMAVANADANQWRHID